MIERRFLEVKNIDLSERLSKKNTIVAIICIVVFLIAGFLAAVLGHIAYVNSREAEILFLEPMRTILLTLSWITPERYLISRA